MAERLIQILVPDDDAERVDGLLDEQDVGWRWSQSSDGTTTFKVLVPAERVEALVDPLEPLIRASDQARLMVLSLEAVVPRREELEPEPDEGPTLVKAALTPPAQEPVPGRISRGELYEDISDLARITPVFLVTTVLATIVAAIGVTRNSAAVVIGAMVIAPLLGPNMALVLATTLGDTKLAGRALKANGAGITVALVVALLAGLVWPLDPTGTEVAARTVVSLDEVLLALATGVAGALAVTTGVASSLVGVMVAVALLPPLVIASMLLVQGHLQESLGASLLLATNVVCVNLSGVVTFYLQGIKPLTWWEESKARRATGIALAVWIGLLVLVTGLILASEAAREA